MVILYWSMLVLHIVACLFLIGVVLLQQGKGQDLASAFGGGGSQTAFGPRGSANVLTRATTILAGAFMVTSLSPECDQAPAEVGARRHRTHGRPIGSRQCGSIGSAHGDHADGSPSGCRHTNCRPGRKPGTTAVGSAAPTPTGAVTRVPPRARLR